MTLNIDFINVTNYSLNIIVIVRNTNEYYKQIAFPY